MSGGNVDLDLGDGHTLAFVQYKDDLRAGANVYHYKPDGSACAGWIPFADRAWAREFTEQPIATWQVVSEEPLTLTPSILCRTCGDHGFIENGKWRKA